jgi:hypothetical protein
MTSVGMARAQETINYASVSGRVTDPQGAVVPGAQVSARQTNTNVTAETITDSEGRFRFPYLKVGPYEVKVHLQGFTDSTRRLTVSIGSAFDLSIALSVGGLDTSVTVTGEAAVSHQAGAHALRGGVDFVFNDDTITYPRSVRGSYTFASMATFLTCVYSGFTQTFGDPVVSQTNPNLGMYVQDEWRVGTQLTLNMGVRYDLQFLEPINTDTNNVSPRVGFAWSPSASHDFIIRGNAGLFFDRVPLRAVANAILSAGNTTDLNNLHQPSVSGIIPTQDGAPTFPNILPARILTTTLVDFTTMDKGLQNAYSKQASVEVERSLGEGRTVSIGYQYLRGENLLMSVNQNVPICVAAGTNNGCRPVSTYRNNSQYSSVADSTYHGLHVSFVQRPTSAC